MFITTEIERAVELQRRSYALLRWATDAIDRGFVSFEALHTYTTLPAATFAWLDRHYADLPRNARPDREELPAFCNLFATYLEGSFEIVEHPGQRLHSPDNHCFCPICSWLIPMPRLRTRQVGKSDKERARKLQVVSILERAARRERVLAAGFADALVADPALRETTALVGYGDDLLRRLRGTSHGPATLALWRRFAWTSQGSPKSDFELRAESILEAEQAILTRIDAG